MKKNKTQTKKNSHETISSRDRSVISGIFSPLKSSRRRSNCAETSNTWVDLIWTLPLSCFSFKIRLEKASSVISGTKSFSENSPSCCFQMFYIFPIPRSQGDPFSPFPRKYIVYRYRDISLMTQKHKIYSSRMKWWAKMSEINRQFYFFSSWRAPEAFQRAQRSRTSSHCFTAVLDLVNRNIPKLWSFK